MKTVIIPENMNPFRVIINGVEYSYPAGTEQKVSNDEAAVIEHHIRMHEELSKQKKPSERIAFCIEIDDLKSKVITPLNDIRDAWLAGRPVIMNTDNGAHQTFCFTLVKGNVTEKGDFYAAQLSRISDAGLEVYNIGETGNLTRKVFTLTMAEG